MMPPSFDQFIQNLLAAGTWLYLMLACVGLAASILNVLAVVLVLRFGVWAWRRLERSQLEDQRAWLEQVGDFNPGLWPLLARAHRRQWSMVVALALAVNYGAPLVALCWLLSPTAGGIALVSLAVVVIVLLIAMFI